jgi:hypothetical protein
LSTDFASSEVVQQLVPSGEYPEHNTLRVPSGQMQSAHGSPPSSVIAAVVHTWAIQIILPTTAMVFALAGIIDDPVDQYNGNCVDRLNAMIHSQTSR